MASTLFGLNFQKLIGDGFRSAGGAIDMTLTRITPGIRTQGALTGGANSTAASEACQGFLQEIAEHRRAGAGATSSGVELIILGDTLTAPPKTGDKATISGSTYVITSVLDDAQGAVYTCGIRA